MTRFRAAVLGSPIDHSLSPVLHDAGYQAAGIDSWEFSRIECTADQLPQIVGESGPEFRGFAVTMPGKFAALEFADEATERARVVGSANTLVRTPAGWRADNTDVEGVHGALVELLGSRLGDSKRAVVLGAGGTSRPAICALSHVGVRRVVVLNRSDRSAELRGLAEALGIELECQPLNRGAEEIVAGADVMVSTVPVQAVEGLEEALAHAPLLDVIYHPWPTALAKQIAANGYAVVGGLAMLANQAYSQFKQFTGQEAPREAMRQALINAVNGRG